MPFCPRSTFTRNLMSPICQFWWIFWYAYYDYFFFNNDISNSWLIGLLIKFVYVYCTLGQIHEQEFGESASGWVNGSFYLDPALGRDTVLAVYFYSRDFNTHVGDIRLISPDGSEHRGISETSMASLYVTPLAAIDKVL